MKVVVRSAASLLSALLGLASALVHLAALNSTSRRPRYAGGWVASGSTPTGLSDELRSS